MESSAIHNALACATPLQAKGAADRRARLERLGVVPRAQSVAPLVPVVAQMSPAKSKTEKEVVAAVGNPINPRLSLSTFVVASSNRVAHAAARQIVETPLGAPVAFAPFYLHGGVGVGKTHLLQAVTLAFVARGMRPLYLTAEKLAYGLLRDPESRDATQSFDALLVDDLQFMPRHALADFGACLGSFIASGKPIVVAADRPPYDLEWDDRLLSRLAGGLTVEVGTMGEELRLDVLRQLVDLASARYSWFSLESGVAEYIARVVARGGRDLFGAVNRLAMYAEGTRRPVTLEIAERELRDLAHPEVQKRITVEDIQRAVARQYNVSRGDILSPRRTANVVRPRQIAMYLAKILTLRSLPDIGRRFGGRDHTTVLHAVRKIEAFIKRDKAIEAECASLEKQLRG